MNLSAAFILTLFTGLFLSFLDDNSNLLINGDFEAGRNGIMPVNWNGDHNVYSLSEDAASGDHSLKYSNYDPSIYKLCTQSVDLKPGMNYTAGIKVKTSDITGEDYGASFCVEWFDENGYWIGGAYPKGIKGTNDWLEINAVVSVPDNAQKVHYCCYVRKGMTGTAWFDDAYIYPYLNNKIRVVMLQPVYRGLLFADGEQKIVLSVNLDNINMNTSGFFLSTAVLDSSGEELVKDSTLITGCRKNYEINLDAVGIKEGYYTATMSLNNKERTTLDFWNKPIRKISKENKPDVYFDDNKKLIVNNKKVFPLGMYWGALREDDLIKYSESKFNFILPYSQPTEEQMKLAEKYNIKVIYSVKDYYAGSQFVPSEIKSLSDEPVLLNQTVRRFKNNPALLAWYNNDEYPPEFIERLNEHYNVITAEDPNHPVLSIIIKPSQTDLYMNSTDIIGSDPYVIPNLKIYMVGEAVETIAKKTNDSQPVWMVIQAHNIGNYKEFIPNPQDYRSPTFDEIRCMSWQAICKGAGGLIYYSYFDLKRNTDIPFETQWSNLKNIVSEIYSFSDVLLSEENYDNVQVSNSSGDISWLDWTTKNYSNKLYIFAVNNGKGEGEISFLLPSKYKTLQQVNGIIKKFSLKDSQFTDSFGNLEVKIYKAE